MLYKNCLNCGNFCDICSDITTCLTCRNGYSLDVVTNQCFICPNNCIKCSRLNTCDVCSPNFTLKNGNCYNFLNNINLYNGCNYGEFRDEGECVTDCPVDKYASNLNMQLTCNLCLYPC